MKRTALLMLLALTLPAALAAQQTPPPPPYPEPRPAPQKGAPLDQRDVDVLTGKTAQRNYVAPYVYVPAGRYGAAVSIPLERHAASPFARALVQPVHPAFFVTGKSGFFVAAPLRAPLLFPLAGKHGGSVIIIRR